KGRRSPSRQAIHCPPFIVRRQASVQLRTVSTSVLVLLATSSELSPGFWSSTPTICAQPGGMGAWAAAFGPFCSFMLARHSSVQPRTVSTSVLVRLATSSALRLPPLSSSTATIFAQPGDACPARAVPEASSTAATSSAVITRNPLMIASSWTCAHRSREPRPVGRSRSGCRLSCHFVPGGEAGRGDIATDPEGSSIAASAGRALRNMARIGKKPTRGVLHNEVGDDPRDQTVLYLRAFAPPAKGGEVSAILAVWPGVRHVVRMGIVSGTDEELITADVDPEVADHVLANLVRLGLAPDDISLGEVHTAGPVAEREADDSEDSRTSPVWAEIIEAA